MKVRDCMSTEVVTSNLRDGLRQTFFRMRERKIRHMPVVGDHDELVGIISDRDLRQPDWVATEENVGHYYLLDNAHKVEDAMTPQPITITPDADIGAAADIMVQHKFGALPVVDQSSGNRVVGIISAIDLLRALRNQTA